MFSSDWQSVTLHSLTLSHLSNENKKGKQNIRDINQVIQTETLKPLDFSYQILELLKKIFFIRITFVQ